LFKFCIKVLKIKRKPNSPPLGPSILTYGPVAAVAGALGSRGRRGGGDPRCTGRWWWWETQEARRQQLIWPGTRARDSGVWAHGRSRRAHESGHMCTVGGLTSVDHFLADGSYVDFHRLPWPTEVIEVTFVGGC
jgi:hypothetical protein